MQLPYPIPSVQFNVIFSGIGVGLGDGLTVGEGNVMLLVGEGLGVGEYEGGGMLHAVSQ